MSKFITAKSLINLAKPFVPLDATWYLPNVPRDAYKEFLEERIPGAVYFDLDKIKAPSPYPHMMPQKDAFAKAMSEMGLKNDDMLVVYDRQGIFSGPRVFWMLQVFGHKNVFLLDNWFKYKNLNGALEHGDSIDQRPVTNYVVSGQPSKWLLFEDVKNLVTSGKLKNHYLLDARPIERFYGYKPEPRPDTSSGHIPGAISLPFSTCVANSWLKSKEEIAEILEEKHIKNDKPIIVMCGSGVTACVIKLAVDSVLGSDALIYDGSWTEWAARAPNLIEQG